MPFRVGDVVTINGSGDLMIERSKGRFIGAAGTVVQITKGGLYIIDVGGERTPPLPARNLTAH